MFRRQHPIGPFILDFYCPAASLAIEVDGYIHGTGDQPQRDERRDAWLQAQGLRVHRIAARDVMQNPDEIADAVRRMAAELAGKCG